MRRQIATLVMLLLAGLMMSCASVGKGAKATVTECPERMFWRIDGTDRKGNPSTVYVQGSFHLGDGKMYPLADAVVKAWENADRLVAEVSGDDFVALQSDIMEEMAESYKRAGGRKITDGLSTTQRNTLVSFLDKDVMEQLAQFEPWITTYSISAALYMGSGLSTEYGLDSVLLAATSEAGRKVEGLDTLQTQMDILTYGSYDDQMDMLRDLLDELKDPSEEIADAKAMYDSYLKDDRASFAKLFQEDMEDDEDKHQFYENYYKMVITDRNKDWAKDIASYLREGGTTFIFAGAGHWVGNDSVFAQLRKIGVIE